MNRLNEALEPEFLCENAAAAPHERVGGSGVSEKLRLMFNTSQTEEVDNQTEQTDR